MGKAGNLMTLVTSNMVGLSDEEMIYTLTSFLTVPISSIFMFVSGKRKRLILDLLLGILILSIPNRQWVALLFVISTCAYFFNFINIKPITIGKKLTNIDLKTTMAVTFATTISFIVQLIYMKTKDRPEGPAVKEFFFNTTMILALKIGYLTRNRISYMPFISHQPERNRMVGSDKRQKEPLSYFEWICYSLSSQGSLSGMALRLEHWEDWINEKWKEEKRAMRMKSFIEGIKNAAVGGLCAVMYSLSFKFCLHQVDTMDLFKYNEFLDSLGINRFALVANLTFLSLTILFQRIMYYVVWQAYRASTCMSQIALEPVDHDAQRSVEADRRYNRALRSESEPMSINDVSESMATSGGGDHVALSFTRCENTPIKKVEQAITMAEITYHWNSIASAWWREFVYKPLVARGIGPAIALFFCNELSALWHGPCVGFHIFFFLSSWLIVFAKFGWRNVRPAFVLPYNRAVKDKTVSAGKLFFLKMMRDIYTAGMFVFTRITSSAASVPFVYLTAEKCLRYLRRIYFLPIWLCPLAALINVTLSNTIPFIKKYKGLKE